MFKIQKAIGNGLMKTWVDDDNFQSFDTERDAKQLVKELKKWQPKIERRVIAG